MKRHPVFGLQNLFMVIVPFSFLHAQSVNTSYREAGLKGRAGIIFCEPWNNPNWWKNGYYEVAGNPHNPPDGKRDYQYPAKGPMSTEIVSAGCIADSCLKVNMRSWKNGGTNGALAHHWAIPGNQENVYLRYYLKLSPNFDPAIYHSDGEHYAYGGKWPGLADATATPQCGNGGEHPNGKDCWSLRLDWNGCNATYNGSHNVCAENGNPKATTRIGWYPYLPPNIYYQNAFWDLDARGSMDGPCTDTLGFGGGANIPNQGPGCGSGVPGMLNNQWYRIEIHVKMNDVGRQNGIMEAWIDGTLRYRKTNVVFRYPGHDNLHVRTVWLNVYAGGVDSGMKEDMFLMLDQLVVANDAPVGPYVSSVNIAARPPADHPELFHFRVLKSTVEFQIDMPETRKASLVICNAKGEVLANVFDGEIQKGSHNIMWPVNNLKPGNYWARFSADGFTTTSKALLLK